MNEQDFLEIMHLISDNHGLDEGYANGPNGLIKYVSFSYDTRDRQYWKAELTTVLNPSEPVVFRTEQNYDLKTKIIEFLEKLKKKSHYNNGDIKRTTITKATLMEVPVGHTSQVILKADKFDFEQLKRYIPRLDQAIRDAVQACYVEGLSIEAYIARSGLHASEARNRISAGLRKLVKAHNKEVLRNEERGIVEVIFVD